MSKMVIAIPARLGSTRLPNKALLDRTGKPLIAHTVERARETGFPVVVVSDSLEVCAAAGHAGAKWCVVKDAWCGTQRVARALQEYPGVFGDVERIINLQMDEPLIEASTLRHLATSVEAYPEAIWTAVALLGAQERQKHDVVKAMVYDDRCSDFVRNISGYIHPRIELRHHIGIYAFSHQLLASLSTRLPSKRATALSLEQLTWLDAGIPIRAVNVTEAPLSINTPEDYELFVEHCVRRA
jgi:3-deoxy-manno-octulosonate cytidylyltransferase (CMP-KDO synthetase)